MLGWIIAAGLGIVIYSDDPPKSVRERYQALSQEYEAKLKACFRAYGKASTDSERQEASRLHPDDAAYARKFFELATEEPRGPAASDALYEMLQLQDGPLDAEGAEALERLRRDFATSPKMGEYLQQISHRPWPGVEPLLREVLGRNPDRTARGQACLGLAEKLSARATLPKLASDPATALKLRKAYGDAYFESLLKQDAEANLREATSLYERVMAEFADVRYFPAHPKDTTTLAKRAGYWLARQGEPAIGKVSPEIEGKDVDGRPFKLSDYRGKVVVLVFWASWCGACMEQIPSERDLVRKLEGRPFALLGVNCDYRVAGARKAMAEQQITWPNWYDGDPGAGPIADRYNIAIAGIPAVFVLDARGVIREKNVRGEALEKAVEALLREPVGAAGEAGNPAR
jgi:peroxiredoxin